MNSTALWSVIIAALLFSMTALGLIVRMGIAYGRDSQIQRQLLDAVERIEKTIGNGEPGVLVRNETFRPVSDELARHRDAISKHADTLQIHEGRMTVLELEAARIRG